MKIISLGAGVQSSTMALMAATGELEKPDCAIFADTGWEPKAVYTWLDWLETQLPYPVYRVQKGNIFEDLKRRSADANFRMASIPAFTWNGGMAWRQCTKEYKIEPIQKKIRELLGVKRGSAKNPVELWIGISLDEIRRMKPSRLGWIHHRWPLLEKKMSREDCLRWLRERDYSRAAGMEPPKSSCIGCPFHDDKFWQNLKTKQPEEWAQAVEGDQLIRDLPGFDYELYLHRSREPLETVNFGQQDDEDFSDNDCEGMCGV